MSTHNTPFLNIKKKIILKSSQICNYRICLKGPKNEFETAVVNEPSVFEPLKFYCIFLSEKFCCQNLIKSIKVINMTGHSSKSNKPHMFLHFMNFYIPLQNLFVCRYVQVPRTFLYPLKNA